jgi:hypothetical protein
LEKYQRMQELYEKVLNQKAGNLNDAKELLEITKELLPYFHFKVDDIDWAEQ